MRDFGIALFGCVFASNTCTSAEIKVTSSLPSNIIYRCAELTSLQAMSVSLSDSARQLMEEAAIAVGTNNRAQAVALLGGESLARKRFIATSALIRVLELEQVDIREAIIPDSPIDRLLLAKALKSINPVSPNNIQVRRLTSNLPTAAYWWDQDAVARFKALAPMAVGESISPPLDAWRPANPYFSSSYAPLWFEAGWVGNCGLDNCSVFRMISYRLFASTGQVCAAIPLSSSLLFSSDVLLTLAAFDENRLLLSYRVLSWASKQEDGVLPNEGTHALLIGMFREALEDFFGEARTFEVSDVVISRFESRGSSNRNLILDSGNPPPSTLRAALKRVNDLAWEGDDVLTNSKLNSAIRSSSSYRGVVLSDKPEVVLQADADLAVAGQFLPNKQLLATSLRSRDRDLIEFSMPSKKYGYVKIAFGAVEDKSSFSSNEFEVVYIFLGNRREYSARNLTADRFFSRSFDPKSDLLERVRSRGLNFERDIEIRR